MEEISEKGVDFSFKDFREAQGVEIKERLLSRPLSTIHEIKKCFILTKKIKQFIDEFEFRDYLFLSPPGTGKTTFLSYMSVYAMERGFSPIWIMIYGPIPCFESFSRKLKLKERSNEKFVFIFDDIHKRRDVIGLIEEIKDRVPGCFVWCTGRLHEFVKLAEYKVLRGRFQEVRLPGFLEREDIKNFLSAMGDPLTSEDREAILDQGRLPVIHLTAIYKHLKTGDTNLLDLTKRMRPDVESVYQAMYDGLTREEKLALKFLAYLDGISPELLRASLHQVGIGPEIIDDLIHEGIIYEDLTYRIAPYFETVDVLAAFQDLKAIANRDMTKKERGLTLPSILLSTESVEMLISLHNKFQELTKEQKKEYIQMLKRNSEDIRVLWVISVLSEYEEELLTFSENAILEWRRSKEKSIARVLFNFGYGYGIRGNFKNSIRCYEYSVKIYPEDAKSWYDLAISYRRNGETQKAIESYKRAIKLDPDFALAWFNLGVAYRFAGKMDRAIECYEKTIEIDPAFTEAWYNLGSSIGRHLETDPRIEKIKAELEANPKNAAAWYNLSFLYMKRNEMGEAIECYERAIEIDQSYEFDWRSIDFSPKQVASGSKMVDVVERYEKSAAPRPEDTQAWESLGFLYGKRGDSDKAISCFEKAIERDSQNALEWYNLGVAYGEKGEIRREIECYREAVSINPRFVNAWYNLGVAYGEIGNIKDEISSYEKVVSLDPGNLKAWHNLGVAYGEIGDHQREAECSQVCKSLKGKGR